MHAVIRTFVLAIAALTLSAASVDSSARPSGHDGGGWHQGGHRGGWGHGIFWGGVGLGVGLGFGSYYYGAPYYYPGYYPGYVLAAPTPVYPVVTEPIANAPPEPVIYPRNGQSAAQTEADRQACDRWAMSQPKAMADASVFQRSTLACMEGRGYTVR